MTTQLMHERERVREEAAKRAELSVAAIRSTCDAYTSEGECSLQARNKDCLCQEREEQAEYIAKQIRAISIEETTLAQAAE